MSILYFLMAILKWLGIILMTLILIVLLVLIIVLISPIKYKLDLTKEDIIDTSANVKWLYSLINVDIIYNSDTGPTTILKLFGIPITLKKKTEELVEKADEDIQESIKDIESQKTQPLDTKTNKSKTNKNKKKKANKQKGNFKETITKIRVFEYKAELIIDTFHLLKRIWKASMPSKLQIYIEVGKEDPADTGQLIGFLSTLIPLYYPVINIVGNYEKECFYGKIEADGSIYIGQLVYHMIQYVRTASVKELIRMMRKKERG